MKKDEEAELNAMIAYGKILLNKQATAKLLDISSETLDRMRKDGDIRSIRVRGQVKFQITEILRYVDEGA